MKIVFLLGLLLTVNQALAQKTHYLTGVTTNSKHEIICRYDNGAVINVGLTGSCKPSIQSEK